jgi:hypothetical protein
MSEKNNMEGRHVGLDFYDLLIEVKSLFSGIDGGSNMQGRGGEGG